MLPRRRARGGCLPGVGGGRWRDLGASPRGLGLRRDRLQFLEVHRHRHRRSGRVPRQRRPVLLDERSVDRVFTGWAEVARPERHAERQRSAVVDRARNADRKRSAVIGNRLARWNAARRHRLGPSVDRQQVLGKLDHRERDALGVGRLLDVHLFARRSAARDDVVDRDHLRVSADDRDVLFVLIDLRRQIGYVVGLGLVFASSRPSLGRRLVLVVGRLGVLLVRGLVLGLAGFVVRGLVSLLVRLLDVVGNQVGRLLVQRREADAPAKPFTGASSTRPNHHTARLDGVLADLERDPSLLAGLRIP